MKRIWKYFFGKNNQDKDEKQIPVSSQKSYVCYHCGGDGIEDNFAGESHIRCSMCMAVIHVGNYKLEVKGTNHEEVESVSLKLINDISSKLKTTGKSNEEKEILKLEDLSSSLKDGEIEKSIDNLIAFCEGKKLNDFTKEVIGLSSRFKNLKKSQRLGTISYDEFVINQNKVINSIAEILNLINKRIKN